MEDGSVTTDGFAIACMQALTMRKETTQEAIIRVTRQMIADHEKLIQQERLEQGKGHKCLFLPFVAEMGHQMMHHVRLVHFMESSHKIVCIQKGWECLYPSANEFFYDWTNPLKDEEKMGTDRCFRSWPTIEQKYPQAMPIQAGGLSFSEERLAIHPEIRIPLKPKLNNDPKLNVDVCIGTRSRALNPRQNWQHCQLIADQCKKMGLTYATIAHPSVGYHLKGETCMSGDFPTMDAAVQLLQNCQYYFSQDSGCGHLASTIGVNMAILQVPHRIWMEQDCKEKGKVFDPGKVGRDFIDRMKEANHGFSTRRIAPEKWFKPEEVLAEVIEDLENIKPKTKRKTKGKK